MSNEHSSDERAETQANPGGIGHTWVRDWLMSDEPAPVNTVTVAELGPWASSPSCGTCGRLITDIKMGSQHCGGQIKCESHSEWIPKPSKQPNH